MPARILLVDDEPAILKGWVKALKPSHYRVFTAETEADAVKVAEAANIQAQQSGLTDMAAKFLERAALYRQHRAYRVRVAAPK